MNEPAPAPERSAAGPPVDLDVIVAGRIHIVGGLLQHLGLLAALTGEMDRLAADLLPRSRSDRLRLLGWDRLHHVLTTGEARSLLLALNQGLRPFARSALRALRRTILRDAPPLHAADRIWLRLMTPHGYGSADRSFAFYPGHLSAHEPHRDSWFSHGENAVNIWCALAPVRPDNGLLIFPDAYGKPLRRQGRSVARDMPIGPPLGFDLAPGDGILFHGEHLHSSALNTTDRTRVSFSVRIALGPSGGDAGPQPLRYRPEAYFQAPAGEEPPAEAIPPQRDAPAAAEADALRLRRRRVVGEIGATVETLLAHQPRPSAEEFQAIADAAGLAVGTAAVDRRAPVAGSPLALSPRSCLAGTGDIPLVLARSCPHRGADLVANGRIEAGALVCGWHKVAFALPGGAPNCPAVADLVRRPARWLDDGRLAWMEARSDEEEGPGGERDLLR
jgi:nitrite reductase/ring-hydroxylating ferredoxin subunit